VERCTPIPSAQAVDDLIIRPAGRGQERHPAGCGLQAPVSLCVTSPRTCYEVSQLLYSPVDGRVCIETPGNQI